jgi:glutamate-1-semialdehyde 2,1-aminomutase
VRRPSASEGTLAFEESRRQFDRALQLTPGGVHSNVRLGEEPWPLFFESADGARLHDVDGNELIDFGLGQGPMLLGHRPPEVVEAVTRQLDRGVLYAGQHDLETEAAELIQSMVPCAERIRFGITGSEAVQAALRMARAATGRGRILKFQGHYHGWADTILFNVGTPGTFDPETGLIEVVAESKGLMPAAGSDLLVTQWNDATLLDQVLTSFGHEIAAVIMEPVMANTGGVVPPGPGYLEEVRRLCDRYGIVLIFDEVITGFRLSSGGAQALLHVTPDLAVFGKAIASGFPVACVGGRSDLLETVSHGGVNHSGTFNGYPVGLAAVAATLKVLRDPTYRAYERIERAGRRLFDGLSRIALESPVPVLVQGYPQLLATSFTDLPAIHSHADASQTNPAAVARLVRSLVTRGVRVTGRGTWLVSAAHTDDDVDTALVAVEQSLRDLARTKDELERQ